MPVNSTTRIETLVSVVAEPSYAFSPQDTLAVATEIPSGGTEIELPSSPSSGDAYEIADGDGSCSSGSPLTLRVTGAGQTIQGGDTLALETPFAWARVTFSESLRAWVAFQAGQAAARFAPTPLPFTTIYVDPGNASGHASDSNPGTSPSAPIRTTAHLNALLFFGVLTADTLIQYLSPDTGSVGLQRATLYLGPYDLTIAQTPQVLLASATLNTGTVAINPTASAGGQRQTLHAAAVADWAPYVWQSPGSAAAPAYAVDATSPRAGNFAWIVSGAGSATASASRPTDSAVTSAASLTIGDAVAIQTGARLNFAAGSVPASDGGQIFVQDVAFDASNLAGDGGLCVATYTRCSFTGNALEAGVYNSCFFGAGMFSSTALGSMTVVAGVLIAHAVTDEVTGPIEFTSDIYVTGDTLDLSNFGYAAFFMTPGFGSGVQCQDMSAGHADAGAVEVSPGSASLQGLLWGNGNAGVGVLVQGATLSYVETRAPSVTGTTGDFAFLTPSALVLVARACVDGAYTEAGSAATRATTWANLVAAVGSGGFAGGAFVPEAGAAIIQIG